MMHKITGGEEDVVEYRWVQNLVMQKSFEQYQDGFTAFDQHILFQKQQEMLYRVDGFRYANWKRLTVRLRCNHGQTITQQNRIHHEEESSHAAGVKTRTMVRRNGETCFGENS